MINGGQYIYRAELITQVKGFRIDYEGSQDWDLALRIVELINESQIRHIPFVLYHWRQDDNSFSNQSLEIAADSAGRSVNEHFARTGQLAQAIPFGYSSHLKIRRKLTVNPPMVSIIIPTKDQYDFLRSCLNGILERTEYTSIEIIIVDNGSCEPKAVELLNELRSKSSIKILDETGPFNFSRLINQGVTASSGEICLLLNNDMDIINPNWLDEMVSHVVRPEVGAVGAKLYYENKTIQHGGVIVGLGGVAGHAHRHAPGDFPGYFYRLNLTHNLSCVTAACLAIRREVFDEIGGLDEENLKIAFNDVDFCLRIKVAGYKIIWTPNAELYHYESKSRGYEDNPEKIERFNNEIQYMKSKWGKVLLNDPYYNPNLSLDYESFEIALPSRVNKPWLNKFYDAKNSVHKRIPKSQMKRISQSSLTPIVFVHVPKTAGSTINALLKKTYKNGIEHYENLINSDEFDKNILNIPWFSGHITRQRFVDILNPHFKNRLYLYSCVRYPLDQVISHLNWFLEIRCRGEKFFLSHPNEIQHISNEAKNLNFHDKKDLLNFLSKYEHFFFNYQSKFIIDDKLHDTSLKSILSSINKFDFIGITENLPPLIEVMGIEFYDLPKENVSNYHFNKEIFYDNDLTEFLEYYNEIDYSLYEQVKKKFYTDQ